ncbi:MAG: hypothetical protein RJB66_1844 [Pseudomonadota bacterium]|jgi:hypothetical protein
MTKIGIAVALILGLVACSKADQPMIESEKTVVERPSESLEPEANQVQVPAETTTMTPLLNANGSVSVRYSSPSQVVGGQQMMGRVSVSNSSQSVTGSQVRGIVSAGAQNF